MEPLSQEETPYKLYLLRPPCLERAGQPTTLNRRKAMALLAYLAVTQKSHSREALAALLWPEASASQARLGLRQVLWDLKRAVGEQSLEINGETVAIAPNGALWSDVHAFWGAVRSSRAHAHAPDELCDQCVSLLQEASNLYQDEFMAGFHLPDCPAFDEWQFFEAENLRRALYEALEKLARHFIDRGDFERALLYARRWCSLDWQAEEPHQMLMRLYAWSGQRSAALRQYELCARLLEEKWGVSPSDETIRLYEAIRENRLALPALKSSARAAESVSSWADQAHLPLCPYRGLFAFREADAPNFFGRESFTRQLIELVEAEDAPRRFLAIIGPSGCGKSSVAYAGLLAHLRQNPSWVIADLRPGSHPFQSLAIALLPLLHQPGDELERLKEIHKLAQDLYSGGLPLTQVITRILQSDLSRQRMILLIDQCEELYSLCWDPHIRTRFLDVLLEVVNDAALRFCLALTLRADFMEQALAHRPFADALQEGSLILGPMNRAELVRAIRNPAEQQGLSFEPGLVERILDEVGEEPGTLPLLEFALTSLWERQSAGWLTHAAHDASGRVRGALTRYAEEVYQQLSKDEQAAAQRLFIQMVAPGGGTNDTRRQARRIELGAEEWKLAQRLADARLLVTNRLPTGVETVEVAHEALIDGWERLRMWMAADRSFRLWQERLRAALQQWENSGRDDRALLQGLALVEAEKWLQTRAVSLSLAETHFIRSSLALQERRRAEREREQAERERQRQTILISLALGLALVLALAIFSVFQWQQAQEARNQALAAQATALTERNRIQIALSRQIAAQAISQLDTRLDLALLLSVKAFRVSPTVEARASLDIASRYNPRLSTYLRGHAGGVRSLALSRDGYLLASGGDDKTIILWDVLNRKPSGPALVGHTSAVVSLAFSPNGRLLASGSHGRTILLWDTITGKAAMPPLEGHTSSVRSLAFSPDGKFLASASDDSTVRLWDISNSQPIGPVLSGHAGGVRSLAFSPDGRFLASGGDDHQVILWQVQGQPRKLAVLSGHQNWVRCVAFNSDGRLLASGDADGAIILWDVERLERRFPPLIGHSAGVLSLAFHPQGHILASGGDDRTIILWDTAAGKPYTTTKNSSLAGAPPAIQPSIPLRDIATGRPLESLLIGHFAGVDSLVFHPNGQEVLSAGGDGVIIIWQISPGSPPSPLLDRLAGQRDSITSIAFSPDGRFLASASRDRTIYLWDAVRRRLLPPILEGHTSNVLCAAFSPQSDALATCGQEQTLRLWDVADHRSIGQPLVGHTAAVRSAAFSPDGRLLASGDDDDVIILWDRFSARATAKFSAHTSGVFSLAFSPQGYILASGGDDGAVRLWDAMNAQPLFPPLIGHSDRVRSVAFSPDGRLLASGSDDRVIRLWDVASGSPLGEPMTGHTSYVLSLAFSPDGKILASGSADRSVRLWDVASGQPIGAPLFGHQGAVRSVAFAPNQPLLASAGDDRLILLWDTSMSATIRYACQRANRNLTPAEWETFFGNEPYEIICPELYSAD